MSWREVLLWEPESTYWECRAKVLYYQTGAPEHQTYVISSWDHGLQVFRWEPPRWVFKEKSPDLFLFNKEGARSFEFHCFAEEIPEEVITLVAGFLSLQLSMLRMARQGKSAMELLRNSRVLFWIIAGVFPKKGWRLEDVDSLLSRRRIDLIREFVGDFPKKQLIAIDRLLRNVILLRGDLIDLKTLLECIQRPEVVKKANSIGRVHITMLSCLNQFPEFLHWKWIRRCAPESYVASSFLRDTWRMWEDTIRLGRALGVRKVEKEVNSCTSLDQLRQKHDAWVEEYNKKMVNDLSRQSPFPSPPVPGNEEIVPIQTPKELFEEGVNMQHCVMTYADEIYKGNRYIYKVLWPERGTLELVPGIAGWRMGEFALAGNAEPSAKSREYVRLWLDSVRENKGLGIAGQPT